MTLHEFFEDYFYGLGFNYTQIQLLLTENPKIYLKYYLSVTAPLRGRKKWFTNLAHRLGEPYDEAALRTFWYRANLAHGEVSKTLLAGLEQYYGEGHCDFFDELARISPQACKRLISLAILLDSEVKRPIATICRQTGLSRRTAQVLRKRLPVFTPAEAPTDPMDEFEYGY